MVNWCNVSKYKTNLLHFPVTMNVKKAEARREIGDVCEDFLWGGEGSKEEYYGKIGLFNWGSLCTGGAVKMRSEKREEEGRIWADLILGLTCVYKVQQYQGANHLADGEVFQHHSFQADLAPSSVCGSNMFVIFFLLMTFLEKLSFLKVVRFLDVLASKFAPF